MFPLSGLCHQCLFLNESMNDSKGSIFFVLGLISLLMLVNRHQRALRIGCMFFLQLDYSTFLVIELLCYNSLE